MWVGKLGILVAGLSAEPLIANRINGKIIGKMSSDRCRTVRTTDRRATASVCSTRPAHARAGRDMRRQSALNRHAASARRLLPGLVVYGAAVTRSLELTAGLGQEHVV